MSLISTGFKSRVVFLQLLREQLPYFILSDFSKGLGSQLKEKVEVRGTGRGRVRQSPSHQVGACEAGEGGVPSPA